MKTYGYINNGILQEIMLPAVYDAEHPDWVSGDPSRIGLEIPIEQRFNSQMIAMMVDITDIVPMPQINWIYSSGVFSQAPIPGSSPEELAESARSERDRLLRSVYDPGIMMALRALRMAASPEETSYAQGKVSELDLYAEALQGVPEQPGFPGSISWPVAPVR